MMNLDKMEADLAEAALYCILGQGNQEAVGKIYSVSPPEEILSGIEGREEKMACIKEFNKSISEENIEKFKRGEIKHLVTVNMFIEGVSIDNCKLAVILRKNCLSEKVLKQITGRVARNAIGKSKVFLYYADDKGLNPYTVVSGDLDNHIGVMKPEAEQEFAFSVVPKSIGDLDEQWFSAASSKATDLGVLEADSSSSLACKL